MALIDDAELNQLRESEEKCRKQVEQAQKEIRVLQLDVEERKNELRIKQAQLVQCEKMASLGNLVAGVAHEINTPLGALVSNNDMLTRMVTRMHTLLNDFEEARVFAEIPQINQLFEQAEKLNGVNKTAARRIMAIVNSLRKFARLDETALAEVDLHDGIDNTLTLLHHEFKNRIEIIKKYGKLPLFRCHPNQLNQIFMNVLVNAGQAIEGKGKITITSEALENSVRISISDTGKGIPAAHLSKIFDPGFTTKDLGVGTGLGLSIVHQIVQDHEGKVEVTSEINKGTTFTFTFPMR